jgi:molecular chaperone GrpE
MTNGSKNGSLETEIDALKNVIAKMFEERQEILDLSHRRNKDFENYKTRTERERTNTFQTQLGNLAVQMLPILDNLDRAVEFAMSLPEGERVEVQQFCDGIILINQQIGEVLGNMGLQTIPTVGHMFDPSVHEAVAMDETGEFPPNTITAEMLRGYSIGDRVIRHSMVKVSKPDASAMPPGGNEREYESEDDREDAALLSEAVRHAEEVGRGSADTPTTDQ